MRVRLLVRDLESLDQPVQIFVFDVTLDHFHERGDNLSGHLRTDAEPALLALTRIPEPSNGRLNNRRALRKPALGASIPIVPHEATRGLSTTFPIGLPAKGIKAAVANTPAGHGHSAGVVVTFA
jgi:hypothetical protein